VNKLDKRKLKKSISGVSKKFKRMAEVYKIFASEWESAFDFSDKMVIEMFNHESFGAPVSKQNGYSLGKKWMDVNIKMWKEDIDKSNLMKWELYDDPRFPHWWLDGIFKCEVVRPT